MVWILGFFTLAGYNFSFWLIVGGIRYCYERFFPQKERGQGKPSATLTPKEVAAIIPAHNEAQSIERTIKALLKVVPKSNIYVASDASTDETVSVARTLGARVTDIHPNRGKAGVIVYTLKKYKLLSRFKAILINDADVEIDRHYLIRAIPLLSDPAVAAIAPHGMTRWKNYGIWEMLFISYRVRLWRVIQLGMRFGQTWKFTNASYIVPGSLCLYRSRVLKKIQIDAPGLIIEDFNMTFELHKKRLGRIAYHPSIFGLHQDPYNLGDYIKQVTRWNLGFWQTVKKNGIWPSFFWLSTGSFLIELILYALFLLSLPALLILIAQNHFTPIPFFGQKLSLADIFIGVFAMDYFTTLLAAFWEKKAIVALYGPAFIILRIIDAFLFLYTLPLAFVTKSSGTWVSPKRR